MPPLGKRTLLVLLYLATRDDAPPLSELAADLPTVPSSSSLPNDALLLAEPAPMTFRSSLVYVIYPLGDRDDKNFLRCFGELDYDTSL
jgi:hypothetical protein